MNVIKFPQKGSACPLCKKWVKFDTDPYWQNKSEHITSWDWHECIEPPKRLKLIKNQEVVR